MDTLESLNRVIVSCTKCERLVRYREQVAMRKVRRFRDCEYWARPVPGFGDVNARLLIIGLAPAAHGANRTGRMFTGDSSGSWLMRALHETGFANKPASISRDDGLTLRDAYITAVLRCAPPDNRPTREEIGNCVQYLINEVRLLRRVRIVLTLGSIAFNAYCRMSGVTGLEFRHGACYEVWDDDYYGDDDYDKNGDKDGSSNSSSRSSNSSRRSRRSRRRGRMITLIASYHPSRQNTQTGRLSWGMWIDVFRRIRLMLDGSELKP
ncbi:MAG: uracil-DNA glycosylase [Candidatus Nitrosocaldus sp.]|nr:uracil-DNA glycosylase [Candidatus Nitrosocaldus sp.]MDW8274880.1 uracil-DNA glycosylase [Candidatus Nitrosocaldus sp.]